MADNIRQFPGAEIPEQTLSVVREPFGFCIRLADGQIMNWPKGTTADVHYKVCDQGEYWLRDEEKRIAKWRDYYVPNDFLCHSDQGYGDYIIFKVDESGLIQGWKVPAVDPDEWE